MGIMTDPGFPAPAIGTVHLENSITAAPRRSRVGETVGVTASVGPARPHPKGTIYDFVTVVTAAGETVWEETSSYLRRGSGDEPAAGRAAMPSPTPSRTASSGGCRPTSAGRTPRSPATTTRSTSTRSTAKALGFPRQIAHGMWTMARCVAALENRLPDAVTVDVAFKRPVLLPGLGRLRLDPARRRLRVLADQPEGRRRRTWSGGPPPSRPSSAARSARSRRHRGG